MGNPAIAIVRQGTETRAFYHHLGGTFWLGELFAGPDPFLAYAAEGDPVAEPFPLYAAGAAVEVDARHGITFGTDGVPRRAVAACFEVVRGVWAACGWRLDWAGAGPDELTAFATGTFAGVRRNIADAVEVDQAPLEEVVEVLWRELAGLRIRSVPASIRAGLARRGWTARVDGAPVLTTGFVAAAPSPAAELFAVGRAVAEGRLLLPHWALGAPPPRAPRPVTRGGSWFTRAGEIAAAAAAAGVVGAEEEAWSELLEAVAIALANHGSRATVRREGTALVVATTDDVLARAVEDESERMLVTAGLVASPPDDDESA